MTPQLAADADFSPGRQDVWQGEGFGLMLRGSYPVLGIAERRGDEVADATRLLLDDALTPAEDRGGERLREVRYADGRVAMAIDDRGGLGLRIVAAEFGAHEISRDGRTIRSCPAAGLPAWRWQRLLIGQALPLAAALRGLELLHASAVTVGGTAFAVAGESGVGKSSLAAQLVLRGNPLLAEDVLAVSLDANGRPQAHPGSVALSLRREDAGLAERLVRNGVATATGSDEKEHVLVSSSQRSVPLGAVYLLSRKGAVEGPIGEARVPTLLDLMRCAYVRYLGTQSRLTAQLSVQAAITQHCSIVPVNVGSGLTSELLAGELEAHMTSIASARRQ